MTDHPEAHRRQRGPKDVTAGDKRVRRAFGALADADFQLQRPPAALWDDVRTQLPDLDGAPAESTTDDDPTDGTNVTPLPARRRRARALLGVAAALTILTVVILATPLIGGRLPARVTEATLGETATMSAPLAVARLDALEPGVASTTAELIDPATVVLRPDLTAQAAGYYEVWLLDETAEALVSLGPLREDGQYTIPEGVSVDRFPVVDISIEPPDGNPAHSGRSVLRGTLT